MSIFAPFSFLEQPDAAGPALDPDAEAFLTATGITDSTIEAAINQLVLDLKADNLWSPMVGIYPFVGSTASEHKYNLKDPQDTDAAFRLTFSGASHASTGLTGLAYTHINIPSDISNSNNHFTVYSRTNSNNNGFDAGAGNGTGTNPQINIQANNGGLFRGKNNSTGFFDFVSVSDSLGFFGNSRDNSSSTFIGHVNGSNYSKSDSTRTMNAWYAIGACGIGELTSFKGTGREYAWASFGSGLSTTELNNLYTIVDDFQTTLSRNV